MINKFLAFPDGHVEPPLHSALVRLRLEDVPARDIDQTLEINHGRRRRGKRLPNGL